MGLQQVLEIAGAGLPTEPLEVAMLQERLAEETGGTRLKKQLRASIKAQRQKRRAGPGRRAGE